MSIKNLPIFAKVFLGMGAFAVLTLLAAAFSTSKMEAIGQSYANSIAREGEAALYMARINRSVYAVYASIGELIIASKNEDNNEALKHLGQARADLQQFLGVVSALGGNYTQVAQKIKSQAHQVIDVDCDNSIHLGQGATVEEKTKAHEAFETECKAQFSPLSQMIISETNAVTGTQEKATSELAQMTRSTVQMTFGVVIGGTALLMIGSFFGIRAFISRPVRGLTEVMERLAQGDNTVEIPDPVRRDEIGSMARAVQVFKDAALEKIRVEAEAIKHQHEAEAMRAAGDATKAQQAKELAEVVGALANGLGQISAGDLRIRLDDRFAPEYERLRSDFNATVQQMQGALRSIVDSVGTIQSGTNEISQAADDLSRRTEQQAASLEETAAALEQITTTVKRAAEGAAQARTVVSHTRADAEQSGVVVQNAVTAMSEIEKSSQQISQIIGVIDEIAFQTNLLALNAGVEAARAGDAGRGFAVVASEVRGLAQRSAEAAREIKTLISASTKQVGAGVKLVGDTGAALKRIVDQVGEVDTVVAEIAASAQEQATGLEQVNTAINEMDQVTQQNAAMVEESTAASRALANETAALAKLTSRFRLGEDSSTVAEPMRRAALSRAA